MRIATKIERLERSLAGGQYCQCDGAPVVVWAHDEPAPSEPDVCERCARPRRHIVVQWADDPEVMSEP